MLDIIIYIVIVLAAIFFGKAIAKTTKKGKYWIKALFFIAFIIFLILAILESDFKTKTIFGWLTAFVYGLFTGIEFKP